MVRARYSQFGDRDQNHHPRTVTAGKVSYCSNDERDCSTRDENRCFHNFFYNTAETVSMMEFALPVEARLVPFF